ncbi:MAG: SpoIIIAH-like family protein [Bacilli bacterium]
MLNKQNLWYITLFSLIVVLCVYYVAMPGSNSLKSISNGMDNNENIVSTISESTELVALRVEADESMLNQMQEFQDILLSESTTVDEKNNAYESLVALNTNKGKEEDLENILLKEFGYNSFVQINGDYINVVIEEKEHNNEIANKIIRRVQKEYQVKKHITVKFQ